MSEDEGFSEPDGALSAILGAGVAVAACPFCEIIERRGYDAGDEWTVTFEPLHPVTPGHRLFVSRDHITDAAARPVATGVVVEYATRWAAGHDVGAFNLITSAGQAATPSVFHLHVHLVPRRAGDRLALPWTAGDTGASHVA